MSRLDRELARRDGSGRIVFRDEPLRVRWRLEELAASDGHMLRVAFSCSAQALDNPIERRMLAETLLADRDAVNSDDLSAHFHSPLRAAAARLIAQRAAEQWLDDSARTDLTKALTEAAKPVEFNCGLKLIGPFEVSVESPTFEREKIESMQRRLAERRAAGQVEHVQRAAELLKQFQALRDAAPALSPGELLEQVNPADRGSMFETLLLAGGGSGAKPQTLWAVAGSQLVKIDPRKSPPTTELIPLPTDLGPLRSVQGGEVAGEPRLLIGAQSGVMVIDPRGGTAGDVQIYNDSGVATQLGFNSVVTVGDAIWASHGDAGIIAWHVGENAKPFFTARPERGGADGPRNLTGLDDSRLIYSAGAAVMSVKSDGSGATAEAHTGATVIAIAVLEGEQVMVIRADGRIDAIDPDTLKVISSECRSGEVCSAGILPWMGSRRMLLATVDGPVICVGADDTLVTQYASVHRGLRSIAASADIVAGVSSDRQRIILWRSWDGRRPVAETHIAGVAKHRAADVCFA